MVRACSWPGLRGEQWLILYTEVGFIPEHEVTQGLRMYPEHLHV